MWKIILQSTPWDAINSKSISPPCKMSVYNHNNVNGQPEIMNTVSGGLNIWRNWRQVELLYTAFMMSMGRPFPTVVNWSRVDPSFRTLLTLLRCKNLCKFYRIGLSLHLSWTVLLFFFIFRMCNFFRKFTIKLEKLVKFSVGKKKIEIIPNFFLKKFQEFYFIFQK
jgi:hypothetical protein